MLSGRWFWGNNPTIEGRTPVGQKKTLVKEISKLSERLKGMDACLIEIYGNDLGKKFPLDKSITVIGRSSKCEIPVDQDAVSRNHAKLTNDGEKVVIKDNGSTNGTYVNDDKIKQATLKNGDLIKIGHTVFKFISSGNIEAAYHDEIYNLTTIDGLTGAYNRRYFLKNLEEELSRSHRYERNLSLLIFRVDDFASLKDKYGHLAGDHVLRQLVKQVTNHIRREDFLARTGDQEFTLILPEIDDNQARIMAEKLTALVAGSEFVFEENTITTSITYGLCTSDDAITDPNELIDQAEKDLEEP